MDDLEQLCTETKFITALYVVDNGDSVAENIGKKVVPSILNSFFSTIITAQDYKHGLNYYNQQIADLIIIDICQPINRSLAFIETIRQKNIQIPIIIFSSDNTPSFLIENIKFGIDGYLLKPITEQSLSAILVKVVEKLSLQKQSEKTENFLQQYKDITDKSAIVSIIDTKGIITYANDTFCQISEYSHDELIGQPYADIAKFAQPQDIQDDLWETLNVKKEMWQGVTKYTSKSGRTYYLKNTIKPILDVNGDILEYIAIRNDITEIMNPRRLLNERMTTEKEPLVVYLKLEDYITLEEFYDAETIEMIQYHMAQYLEANVPSGCHFDKVYQLGYGEYVFTNNKLACMQDEEQFFLDLKKLQDRINRGAINLGGMEYDMSMVMSIAYEGEQILESARLGIKQLLESKRDFMIANDLAKIEREEAQHNIQIISKVKKAIHDLNIVSYFQPIVNNQTRQIEKYESLVRLLDGKGNLLPPDKFLEIAKKGRYYSQITSIVLENSFKVIQGTNLDISINISALDIEKDTTRQKIINYLVEHKQQASHVILELLEDESTKDFDKVSTFINEVKQLGAKIAIDDFGAGYSNYERLLDYQPDIIKIDGSLIRNITTSDYVLSIVRSILLFAQENKIKVVAEYVENETIYLLLKELGVEYSQGYYFGKPQILNLTEL